jgi:hypothetical protein
MKIHYIVAFTPTLKLPLVACGARFGQDSSTHPTQTTCHNCRRTHAWRGAKGAR